MRALPSSSLVISTYNWPQALELCLLSVLQQKILPQEIVIADDGSKVETKNLVDNFRSKFSIPIKHVWHKDDGFKKTIILNEAVRNSTGEYIIQIDGDIIIHPLFIKEHLISAKKKSFIRGSRTLINTTTTQHLLNNKKFNINFYSKGLLNRLNALHSPILSTLIMLSSKSNSPKDVIGCNTSFWKDDFIQINGYNNDIVGWGREDGELAARLINNNIQKKKLKFMAICFHLYHNIYARDRNEINTKLLNDVIKSKITFCENGYVNIHAATVWE